MSSTVARDDIGPLQSPSAFCKVHAIAATRPKYPQERRVERPQKRGRTPKFLLGRPVKAWSSVSQRQRPQRLDQLFATRDGS